MPNTPYSLTKKGPQKNDQPEEASLIQIIFDLYGYDFTNYSGTHVKRRVEGWMIKNSISDITTAKELIKTNEKLANSLIKQFSVSVTEMFRNPQRFIAIRENVLPLLRTYPFIRIWHAGCATGEEVYSMAIMLNEEGLLDRCRIYATDFNEATLQQAQRGIYTEEQVTKYAINYKKAKCKNTLSDYFKSRYESSLIKQKIRENIVWSHHNLVSDSSFNEFHLIVCCNVLIYFNKDLQNKVLTLFKESLVVGGYICLGSNESLNHFTDEARFKEINKAQNIYRLG